MPQREVPSAFFFRNGHLKTSSQHAPQRLHSPRRSASAAIVSSLRKLVMTKRRNLPWACRARSFASATLRERMRRARRVSNGRDLLVRALLSPDTAQGTFLPRPSRNCRSAFRYVGSSANRQAAHKSKGLRVFFQVTRAPHTVQT